jgi:mannose-6-phosphate isomerase-like protein (cupin superfamily)
LLSNGDAEKVAGGEAFWKLSDEKKDSFGTDWLISEYNFNGNWENWEMHSEGDEIVYVLNGKARIIFDLGDEIEQSTMNIKIVTRMLHITMGKGTLHRPRKRTLSMSKMRKLSLQHHALIPCLTAPSASQKSFVLATSA